MLTREYSNEPPRSPDVPAPSVIKLSFLATEAERPEALGRKMRRTSPLLTLQLTDGNDR